MNKKFSLGLGLGIFLAGCVSATFPYAWYYPDFVSYEGKLLGKKPSQDLDGKICAIDPNTHEHGCVVMLKKDFEAFVLDYMDLQNQLQTCQKP